MPGQIDFDVEITRVLLAHRFTIKPNMEMDTYLHRRGIHGMVCPIDGSGEFLFAGGRSVRLQPGEIALIPASSAYRLRAADEKPFEHYTVNFLGSEDSLPEWIPRASLYVLKPKNPAMYLARFQEMTEIWQRMRAGFRMNVKARLLSLMADCLVECIAQNVDPAAYCRMLPARRLMETRYNEPLTLHQLAAACCMNEGSFRRVFTAVYGQPPIAHLLSLRMEKAKELLLIGSSLEETALQVGFSDVNYFIRYFKKATGMTPGHFRQMY